MSFVVNSSEKVLIGGKGDVANNHVYAFRKSQPSS